MYCGWLGTVQNHDVEINDRRIQTQHICISIPPVNVLNDADVQIFHSLVQVNTAQLLYWNIWAVDVTHVTQALPSHRMVDSPLKAPWPLWDQSSLPVLPVLTEAKEIL